MERPCDTTEISSAPYSRPRPRQEAAPFDPLARMMAHEVRNILTPMRAKAQMAMDHLDDQSRTQRALEWAIKASQRIAALTDTILLGASDDTDHVSLDELLVELREDLPARDGLAPRVTIDIRDEASVVTTPTALRHILLNLLLNADRASANNNGSVNVMCERSTWNTDGVARSGVSISIEDDGRGLDEFTLTRLNRVTRDSARLSIDHTTPLENESSSRMSPAVGLFVVEKMLSMVDGEIQAVNMPVGGARITIRIPDLDVHADSSHSQAA